MIKSFEDHTFTLEIKKSKFIGISFFVDSVAKFEDILKQISIEHEDAKHICYGYKINDNGLKIKAYNSTEPKGTATIPILSSIEKMNAINIAIIVIRYFGKTKIGKSNLYRSYLKCSSESLKLLLGLPNDNR